MKIKIIKAVALIQAMLCILCFPIPASAVAQGTDGTELQVMKPQNLQIHLGEDWAGAGFELTTDAGKYPGIIVVGEDGVLRLEIGGSENYILSCVNTAVEIPTPLASAPAETEDNPISSNVSDTTGNTPDETHKKDSNLNISAILCILCSGGLALTLAMMRLRKSKRYDKNDEI